MSLFSVQGVPDHVVHELVEHFLHDVENFEQGLRLRNLLLVLEQQGIVDVELLVVGDDLADEVAEGLLDLLGLVHLRNRLLLPSPVVFAVVQDILHVYY